MNENHFTPPEYDPKKIPFSLESEMTVLGTVLINPKLMNTVMPALEKDDFYLEFHVELYDKITEMYRKSKNIDLITLLDRLGGDDSQRVKHKEYLMRLADSVPVLEHIADYCEIVKKHSYKRQAQAIVRSADFRETGGKDITEVISETSKQLADIIKDRSRRQIKSFSAVALEQYNKIILGNGKNTRIDTGIKAVDDILGGMFPKDLITIAAGTSVGKTAFVLQIVTNIIKSGKKIILYSQEMSSEQNIQRILARWSGIALEKIINAASTDNQILTEEEQAKLCRAFDVMFRLNAHHICDDTALKVSDIELDCLVNTDTDIIFIDHIGLMRAERPKNIREDTTNIMKDLKALASRIQKPIVVLSQINREPQGKEPELWHLKESGEIEQSSSAVMMMWRDANYERNKKINIKVAKNRQGKTNKTVLNFYPEIMMFDEPVYNIGTNIEIEKTEMVQEALDI